MTILQPHSYSKLNPVSIFLGLVLVSMAAFSIYFYNQNVNLRHAVSQASKELQIQRTSNADFKNRFYQIFNSKNVKALAEEKGLISEKNPAYLKTGLEILASN